MTTSSQPKTNTDGNLVWNPSVGIYAKPAADKRESYGGVIGALQDVAVEAGFTTKAYPENFGGIIAAIQDLTVSANSNDSPVVPGPNPGGGTIDPISGDWIEITKPDEGSLWFDTRQGRLFVYIENEWIQTNGADGLAQITNGDTPPAIETPAPGQFWYDLDSNSLYIHDGQYVDSEGILVPPTDADASPLWRLLNSAEGDSQGFTTATLALAGAQQFSTTREAGDIVTGPDLNNFHTQQDYNLWAYAAILELEEDLVRKSDLVIGDTPPSDPATLKPGVLWYDTESLDLSIYYDDGSTKQWVPVSAPYSYDEDLNIIRQQLAVESQQRDNQIQAVYAALNNIDITSDGTIQSIQANIATAQQKIQSFENAEYITKAEAEAEHAELAEQIAAIDIPDYPDLELYAKQNSLLALEAQVNALPKFGDLQEVQREIPSVDSFVTQNDITAAINGITTDYLSRSGGRVNGGFVFNGGNYDSPVLDFSSSPANSRNAFKFQALAPSAGNYSTFGTTNRSWEQAWQFAADEDFCWIYNDSNKVFSVTKEGPACSQLYIGDFGTNNNNGRVINNKIDVRDRLTTYQTAFKQLRQAVNSATDFDSLKAGLQTALANV